MRVIFMGTPAFSVPSLDALVEAGGIEVVAAFTQPDAISKRGKALQPTAVRVRAEELGLPVLTPANLNGADAATLVGSFEPDAIAVVSYGNILPPEILGIPPLGCINAHASLLPRWRGAAPIERAILADDEQTGVSIMRMERELDTGPYCMQAAVPVGEADSAELTAQLARMGAAMLVEALRAIEAGDAHWTPQNPASATYAEKVTKAEMLLSPAYDAAGNVRRVRASGDRAPARAVVCGRQLAVLAARELVVDGDAMARAGIDVLDLARMQPGDVLYAGKRLLLAAADGAFEVLQVKPDGKKPMDAAGFAAGVHAQLKSGTATWQEVDR